MPGFLKVRKVSHGRYKGQWRFSLIADNGENLSPNESYFNEADILSIANKYFKDFEVVRQEKKKRPKKD